MKDTLEFPRDDFSNFWADACGDIPCLNDSHECKHPKDPNKIQNPLCDKNNKHYHQNQLLLFSVIQDIKARTFISPPSMLHVPKLCLDYLKEHYIKLDNGAIQRGLRQVALSSASASAQVTGDLEDFEELDIFHRVNFKRALESIMEQDDDSADSESISYESRMGDTIQKMRKLHNQPLVLQPEWSNSNTDFEVHGHNWSFMVNNFKNLVDSYNGTIAQMCKDAGVAQGPHSMYLPAQDYPIETFNNFNIETPIQEPESESTDHSLMRNNSLYDTGNIGAIMRAALLRELILYGQSTRSRAEGDIFEESENYEEQQALQRERLLLQNISSKVCNEKLKSLIDQSQNYLTMEDFTSALYNCLDEESRAISDLESLIQISNRNSAAKPLKPTLSGSNLYNVKEAPPADHIHVSYTNCKIVPTMAMDFKLNTNSAPKMSSMVLQGKERIDVNFEELYKTICSVNTRYLSQILEALHAIDQRIASVAIQCQRMHRALYRFHKMRLGLKPPPMEPEAPIFSSDSEEELNVQLATTAKKSGGVPLPKTDSGTMGWASLPGTAKDIDWGSKLAMLKLVQNSDLKTGHLGISNQGVNDLEELLNLETLHLVVETLMETKIRLLKQAQREVSCNIEILHAVMPPNCYQVLTNVLYDANVS
ncbi:hypothetical protein BdWA1_002447 [Babesia duncani]|uniref:Uncharacterized protein n=1 Tax=Babesia duncani TaxID=323732 RepID=A0AAD9UNG4_9APIC|nr:hypothetical protein BdWA1_002447 [Babesia duncani]